MDSVTKNELTVREIQIAELLLQGYDNAEIGKELGIKHRTVKAHFNRMFLRYGIKSGIKRVQLATLLYRRQLCHQQIIENQSTTKDTKVCMTSARVEESQPIKRNELYDLSQQDLKTKRLRKKLIRQSMSLKTISASSTISLESGTERNSRCGMSRGTDKI